MLMPGLSKANVARTPGDTVLKTNRTFRRFIPHLSKQHFYDLMALKELELLFRQLLETAIEISPFKSEGLAILLVMGLFFIPSGGSDRIQSISVGHLYAETGRKQQ